MNWQFHKQQSSTVTDKQADLGKLFDWLKKFYWSHVQLKIEKNSYKMTFKALPVTIQQSKNQQGGAHCAPPPGQIGLKIFQKEGGIQEGAIYNKQGT